MLQAKNVIAGNVVIWSYIWEGYINGRAGERFAVVIVGANVIEGVELMVVNI